MKNEIEIFIYYILKTFFCIFHYFFVTLNFEVDLNIKKQGMIIFCDVNVNFIFFLTKADMSY